MARNDPYSAFNFVLSIDGIKVAGFTEAGGLTSETDAIEYREGNEENRLRKLPGLKKYTNITLKRGFTQNKELWDWRKSVMNGETERKSGSVSLLDEGGETALTWNFQEGWPCKWEGPSLNAKNNEAAVETLEICHESLDWV